MATIASIMVKIGANSAELRKELQDAKKELNTTLGPEAMAMSSGLAMGIAGAAAALGALGVKAVQAAGNMQQITAAMTNMLGSAEAAKSLLGDLQNFAAKTPFEFNDVAAASQKFLAFGFTAEQIIPTLRAVGDAAAGVGLGKAGVERITLALGQMAAKTKVQGDEMLQLTEAGIPAWQMLADKIGVTVPQAMDMASKGAIDAQTGLQALVGGMEQRFGGMMDQQAATITGTWSNLMDGLSQSAIAVGQKISDAFHLPELFTDLGNQLQEFASIVNEQGIGEALSQMIPIEVQAAAAALAFILTTAAIPAVVNLGTTAAIAAVSLTGGLAAGLGRISAAIPNIPTSIGAVTSSLTGLMTNLKSIVTFIPTLISKVVMLAVSFGPIGIAVLAVGAAIAFFIASGNSLEDMLNVVPGTMGAVSQAGDALKMMFGEIGLALQNLLSAAAPLIALLASAFTVAIYAIIAAINVFATILSALITVVSTIITAIVAVFNWLYDAVSTALGKVGNALSDMADSILPEWAKSGLATIKGFVDTAIGWLNKLIDKIFKTNNALSKAGEKSASAMTDNEKERRRAADSNSATSDTSTNTPTYDQFKTSGGDAAAEGNYDVRAGAIYNAQLLTGKDYGTGDGQVICTTYIENAWNGAGVGNAYGLSGDATTWASNAGAAFHSADSGYVGKPGDAVITSGSGYANGHVIMIDENGTGYYAAGGWKGQSAHYDQDYHDAFAGGIYGYVNLAEYAGVQDKSPAAKPFDWSQSMYTEAIHGAASAYSIDPKVLLAIAMRETGGDTVSGINMNSGIGGMMQVSPDSTIWDETKKDNVKIADLYPEYATDVNQNALAGAAMLKDKIRGKNGDVWAGVEAYNGGGDPGYRGKVQGNFQKLGGNGQDLVEKEILYRKQMLDKALQTDKEITDSYNQATMTQVQLCDQKYQTEYADLEKAKAFNSNYAADKKKLDEMYAKDHLKAVEADTQKELEVRKKALEVAATYESATAAITKSPGNQALDKMAADHEKAISTIESQWQKYAADYAGMTTQEKNVFLQSLNDQGVAYELSEKGQITFHKEILADKLAADKAYHDQRLAYINQAKDIESDIEDAKNQVSMARLQEVLDSESAMRLNNYEAQKSMMDTYQDIFLAAHATTAQMVAGLYSTAFSGVSSALTDLVMGTKTLGSAFANLGKSMIQVIVEYYAKQVAGMILAGTIGKQQQAAATAMTAAEGLAMAGALAPAAFFKLVLDPGAAGVAMSLMSTGATFSGALSLASQIGAAGGTGLFSDTQSGIASGTFGIPKMASGGITKGTTIGMIGEGRYEEAVLPLSREKFERLGLINDTPSAVNQFSINIQALDGKSVERVLKRNGSNIIKSLENQASKFAGRGVVTE